MIHSFATFEIDEAKRELRVMGRVIVIQPRVLDVLAYLAKNHQRVVPKEELLDSVWPGVIVTDASLQRAISLARSAVAGAGGNPDTIRTHARQGYRLCDDLQTGSGEGTSAAATPPAAMDSPPNELRQARRAFERGDWEEVIRLFQAVDSLDVIEADDLQCWAHAAQCTGRPQEAMPLLERAVAAFTVKGERRRAAWVAILLAYLRLEWREPALAKGWLHRASRLLQAEPACREKGYIDLLTARMAISQNEMATAITLAQRAREIGETFDDPDLETLGLVFLGSAKLYSGQVRDGLEAIDEAGAAVVASGLSSWAGGMVYCCVIYSCLTRVDWHRATQWTEQFTRWTEGRGTAGYPGLCRMHRAEILTVGGKLTEAESEIRGTLEMLANHAPWAEGDAWRVLGDIRLAKGMNAEARSAYMKAIELGWECQFDLAMVTFAEGDAATAARQVARTLAIEAYSCKTRRGQALAHYVIMASAAGMVDAAREALEELLRVPELTSTPALGALTDRARGELAGALGDRVAAVRHFRNAIRTWTAIDAPLRAAQVRCRLARFLADEGDRQNALLELTAAENVLKPAGAEGWMRSCQQLRTLAGQA